MTKLTLSAIFIFWLTNAYCQYKTIVYKASDEDFVNPERGFYIPTETKASHFKSLDVDKIAKYRLTYQHVGKATYSVRISLLYRAYELDTFKDRPLSTEFLDNVQKDLDAVRQAGLKVILRFAYTNSAKSGNCRDAYHICPPYGDAPVPIVMQHIAQLKPLLQKNADVIAVLQEGFIGIWGENYFTDYFGDASNNGTGRILDSSWTLRGALLKALLDALPGSRMVQVRTPQIKQKFVYGPSGSVLSPPLAAKEAFSNSYASRIGFHNDCFLSSIDDYGTYDDYGSSTQPRMQANEILRRYMEADSKYTVVGGETCDDAYSPQNDCAPFGFAEREMAAMHYSYLNSAYNNDVNNDWDSLGCMKSIKLKLGYRFILKQAILPLQLRKGQDFTLDMNLENAGYATPFNPRPVELILRNTATGRLIKLTLKTQIQQWFTGPIHLKEEIRIPLELESGNYEVLLNLPDGFKSLQDNPAYSIRFANENAWEPGSGFNKLNHVVGVK